jgi:hypothetical protein
MNDVIKQVESLKNSSLTLAVPATVALYASLIGDERSQHDPSNLLTTPHELACIELANSGVTSNIYNGFPWTLEDTILRDVVVYKALGSEATLAEYNQAQLEASATNSYSGNISFDRNWSAMYTQFMKSHTIGTVAYRWEAKSWRSAYSEAHLVEVRVRHPLPVIIVTGVLFWDGHVDSVLKANLVKDALRARGYDIASDEGLMEAMGRHRIALAMQETEFEWELIFEHNHLAGILAMTFSTERLVATFYKNPAIPITSHWKVAVDSCRRRCDDLEQCADVLTELGETDLPSRFTHFHV